MEFNSRDALNLINFKQREKLLFPLEREGIVPANHITYVPEKVEIKHAKHWKTSKGTLSGANIKIERVKEEVIPVHKLGAHNEMLFYH
jgi:hypothetical protein